jgi:hypothetical protein
MAIHELVLGHHRGKCLATSVGGDRELDTASTLVIVGFAPLAEVASAAVETSQLLLPAEQTRILEEATSASCADASWNPSVRAAAAKVLPKLVARGDTLGDAFMHALAGALCACDAGALVHVLPMSEDSPPAAHSCLTVTHCVVPATLAHSAPSRIATSARSDIMLSLRRFPGVAGSCLSEMRYLELPQEFQDTLLSLMDPVMSPAQVTSLHAATAEPTCMLHDAALGTDVWLPAGTVGTARYTVAELNEALGAWADDDIDDERPPLPNLQRVANAVRWALSTIAAVGDTGLAEHVATVMEEAEANLEREASRRRDESAAIKACVSQLAAFRERLAAALS